jgi:hypothetical protein
MSTATISTATMSTAAASLAIASSTLREEGVGNLLDREIVSEDPFSWSEYGGEAWRKARQLILAAVLTLPLLESNLSVFSRQRYVVMNLNLTMFILMLTISI